MNRRSRESDVRLKKHVKWTRYSGSFHVQSSFLFFQLSGSLRSFTDSGQDNCYHSRPPLNSSFVSQKTNTSIAATENDSMFTSMTSQRSLSQVTSIAHHMKFNSCSSERQICSAATTGQLRFDDDSKFHCVNSLVFLLSCWICVRVDWRVSSRGGGGGWWVVVM